MMSLLMFVFYEGQQTHLMCLAVILEPWCSAAPSFTWQLLCFHL